MGYKVTYENDSTLANTAAQRVTVRVPIDSHLNPLSFELGHFGFGPFAFEVPAQQASYFTTLDLPDSLGYDVQVTAGVDIVGNELFWVLQSIDPKTGLPPTNPVLGFLKINDAQGNGEGFVTYTIKAKETAATGDTIKARATIVFDTNEPIATNQAQNTLDAKATLSNVNALPSLIDSTTSISVSISDDLKGSGVSNFDVYVSEDGKAYSVLARNLRAGTTTPFKGKAGSNYCFYSIGRDNTGNEEGVKTISETCTHVKGGSTKLALLMPNGGEEFCAGSTVSVQWASEGINKVNLLYSSNGGASYTLLTDTAHGKYQWTLPSTLAASDKMLLKVVDASNATNVDSSNHVFAVGSQLAHGGKADTVCLSAPSYLLSGYSPENGIWSGTGVSPNGVFSPSAAGAGSHTLSYEVTVNSCQTSVNKEVVVKPAPAVSLTAFDVLAPTASAYVLKGGTPAGGTYAGMGVSNGTIDPALTNVGTFNITYTYNGGGECVGRASQPIRVSPAIEAPTNLQVEVKSSSQIALTWVDNSLFETGYVVERSLGTNSSFVAIDTLAANATSFADAGLAEGTIYFYRVRAINENSGPSPYSNEANGKTKTTSIVNQGENEVVKLYPNVAHNYITVEFQSIQESEVVTVLVYNELGAKILEQPMKAARGFVKDILYISHLQGGVYFVRVLDGDKMYLKSFVKD